MPIGTTATQRLALFPAFVLLSACGSTPAVKAAPVPAPQFAQDASQDDPPLEPDFLPAAAATRGPGSAPPPASHYPNLDRRFSLSVGAALLRRFDTDLQVSSAAGVGALLDLEDLLGIERDSTVLRVDASYAFNQRHSIQATWYDIGRSGSRTIGQDIEVGDVVLPAGGVTSSLGTEIIKAAYRYNFVRDERTVIGFSAGLHFMQVDFAIASDLGGGVSESFNANLPVPVLGLHGEYALGPRWKLYASAELLQVDIGFFRGLLQDNRLGIEHDLFDNVGWGVGYNSFNLNASVEGDRDLTAEMRYSFQGLMLYLRTYF
jgi:hypothetical protein